MIAIAAILLGQSKAGLILAGAKGQLVHPAQYTPGYFFIGYPGGDLPASKGVCTDVVVRSFRHAGYDLQVMVHEDMKRHLLSYPRHGAKADPNIDHRRVPNLVHYLSKYGKRLTIAVTPATLPAWHAGDVVFWILPNGLDHCGVVSDRKDAKGIPLVIHNISQTAEEDVLCTWKIVGHYRYP